MRTLLVTSWVALASATSAAEPAAHLVPALLELAPLPPPDAEGRLAVDVVLRPLYATQAELSIVEPHGLRFESGASTLRVRLVPGEPERRERVWLPLAGAGDPALAVVVHLVEDDGTRWQTVERRLHLGEPAP
jgi:hypothetical protein